MPSTAAYYIVPANTTVNSTGRLNLEPYFSYHRSIGGPLGCKMVVEYNAVEVFGGLERSTLKLKNQTFTLRRIRFYKPAQTRVNGKVAAAEAQFVHKV